MQPAEAKSAFVQFMVSLGLREPAAIAIAENNDDHASLLGDFYSNRFLEGVPDEELPAFIAEFLGLPQALQGEHLELTKKTLAEHFRCVRIATAAGKNNAAVTIVRRLVDEYTCPFGVIAPERDLLDYAICLHSVTINGLRDARSKPDGVMSLFPSGMREYLMRKIPKTAKILEHLLAEQDKLRRALHMLCPAHGFNPSQARIIYAKLLQDSVTFGGLHDAIPTDSREPAENVACGVMRVFRGPEKREALKKQFENIQALLEDLARNGPELGADFELGVEPADFEPVAAHITAPSRKRVLVPEALEEPGELFCEESIADLDRKCCSTDSTHDTTASGEEASGFRTPELGDMSDRERKRLLCAPLKKQRGDQD
jgi:hypothetical protein